MMSDGYFLKYSSQQRIFMYEHWENKFVTIPDEDTFVDLTLTKMTKTHHYF